VPNPEVLILEVSNAEAPNTEVPDAPVDASPQNALTDRRFRTPEQFTALERPNSSLLWNARTVRCFEGARLQPCR